MATSASTALDDQQLTARLRERFQDAKSRRKPIVQKWLFNYATVNARPWSATRQSWMPAPNLPEVFPILSTRVAWVLETQPTFDCAPISDPNSEFYSYNQQLGNHLKLVMDACWTQNNYTPELERILWDLNIYGTGITSTLWDPNAASGLGDAVMKRVDPFMFYPDPDAATLDDCQYMFEIQKITLAELDRRFPGAAEKLMTSTGGVAGQEKQPDPSPSQLDANAGQPTFDPLGKSGKDSSGADTRPQWATKGSYPWRFRPDEQVLVYFAWIKDTDETSPDHPQFEDQLALRDPGADTDDNDLGPNGWTRQDPNQYACWRCVVFVDNIVLLDEDADDLWGHGQHPYDRVVEQEMGEFWGKSMVDLLAPAQLSLNRLLSAIEHNIWLMGNPILLEDKRSGISRQTITNKPGQRLRVNPGAQVQYMNPPTMQPQMAVDLLQFYIAEMERISGISGMQRGAAPGGRNPQAILDSLNEAAFVRVRAQIRNLEGLLRGVGNKQAALICEFYDTPRLVAMIGPDGQATALAIRGKHFYTPTAEGRVPLRFQLDVEAGSSGPTSKSARMAEADTLFSLGGIDREALLTAHDFPNWQIIVQRMRALEAVEGPAGPSARTAGGRSH